MGTMDAHNGKRRHASAALKFVLLVGAISFFADFTYEGARSVIGPYLAALGASALAVGAVTGFGELLGYGLRLVSGRLSDRTKQFWPVMITGYVLQNDRRPPAGTSRKLADGGPAHRPLERVGKATRNPPRDAMQRTPRGRWATAGLSVCTRHWTRPGLSAAPWPWPPYSRSTTAATDLLSPCSRSRPPSCSLFLAWRACSTPVQRSSRQSHLR